eukprot:CAMPEP_0118989852 /NCGR_PEP_ID=MMETSP1173-20130426/48767_1 /TAXON_ID=1034831 /ORGANISM="Rhizochromulina marina cf, Strain CCMP1243" /LENGTH=55 /DNA_ID=CAMNT_0006940861 /DNA_START=6 /DNA_END=169 /DNA_ORIENTATION=+
MTGTSGGGLGAVLAVSALALLLCLLPFPPKFSSSLEVGRAAASGGRSSGVTAISG